MKDERGMSMFKTIHFTKDIVTEVDYGLVGIEI